MALDRVGIIGLSARRQGSEQLARFTLSKEDQPHRLPEIARGLGAREMVYLATCNRVEVALRAEPGIGIGEYRKRFFRLLTGSAPLPGEAERTLRAWVGEGAVEHLMVVSCGLDSAQVGEPEIRGQVRDALRTARRLHTQGPLLDFVFDEALRVSGAVRMRVRMDGTRTSLADVATEHLLERARRTPGAIALFGVSPMTLRCGRELARREIPLFVVNRTPERAVEMARELGAELRSLQQFRERPERVEALLLSTGSPEPVLDRAALERIAARTPSGEPPLVIDMAVPPDVDPEVARLLHLERLGMDEINAEAGESRNRRLEELAPARELIDEALDDLRKRFAERMLAPLIARLNQRYRETARAGIERLLQKELPGLDPAARQAIADWAEVLAKRFAHIPTLGLRGLAAEWGAPAVRTFLESSGEDCFADVQEVTDRIEEFTDLHETGAEVEG